MTENVVRFPGITRLDSDPGLILEGAKERGLEGVVLIGFEKETGAFYFASSYADGGNVIWLLEMAKKKLLEIAIGD